MRSPPLRGFYVPLRDPVARRALGQLAERERRDPQEQAVVLILEGLRAACALPLESHRELTPEPPAALTPR